jgi:hypothetical protein
VLTDKAYSSRAIRGSLRLRRIQTVIPEPADQIKARFRKGCKGGRPPAFAKPHKQRNTVERAINKLHRHRAVAARYHKRGFVYRGTVDVAIIRIWLRDPSHDLRGTRPSAGKARGAWVKYRVKVTGCLLEGT